MSRLSDQTVREAEDYLNKYRHMNLELSQQMGWRVMAAIEAQVTPSPPPFAQPLDVIATVLALRRKQPGTGLSSPSALVLPSLGYEASGSGLRRLSRSPLRHLTSANVWEAVVYGRPVSPASQPPPPRLVYRLVDRGAGFPRAGAGKILPRPRRTVGGETAGPTSPYARGQGAEPPRRPFSRS